MAELHDLRKRLPAPENTGFGTAFDGNSAVFDAEFVRLRSEFRIDAGLDVCGCLGTATDRLDRHRIGNNGQFDRRGRFTAASTDHHQRDGRQQREKSEFHKNKCTVN